MDDDEEDLYYSDKTLVEQRDEQKTISTINNSSVNTSFSNETEKLTSNRRRVRVKFAYSFDNDQLAPIIQTAVIKTEPCFKVTKTEDEVTKHFYQNKSQIISKENEKTQLIEEKILSDPDSLEEEYSPQLIRQIETTHDITDIKHSISHRAPSSSPIKSILKKPKKKEGEKITIPVKLDRSLKSRSPSPSSKKTQTSSTRLDFNDVQHLAEITAKQNLSSSSIYSHSLFDRTINIFDPNNSSEIISNSHRPSRLQYYIKPYRGEANVSTDMNKPRSRSFSHQPGTTTPRSSTKQSNRKQHISWLPARDYIYHGRDHTIVTPTRKKKTLSGKSDSSLLSINPSLSLSNPCLRHFPSSIDSYHTLSIIDRPLTSLTSVSQYNYNKEEKETADIEHQNKKEHEEIMGRYDRLLEKMRATDEELQLLSRSWTNNTPQTTPVKVDRRSNLSLNKTSSDSHSFSPMILQICLIVLIIFNLLVVYFFNEINVWWSENIAPGMIMEHHHEDILIF